MPKAIKSIRLRFGYVQVPTVTMRNATGRTVQVVGVIHVARPGFWRSVNKRIADHAENWWHVHFERSNRPTEEESAALGDNERRLMGVVNDMSKLSN